MGLEKVPPATPKTNNPPGYLRGVAAGRAVSRVLFPAGPGRMRGIVREMVICLGWPSPATSSSLPAALPFPVVGVGHTSPPIWPCSDWGLPCHRCYQRRGGLLPHRFTLTRRKPCGLLRAVSFLWPCPSPSGAQALPGSLPYGARTFLGNLAAPATIALDQWV